MALQFQCNKCGMTMFDADAPETHQCPALVQHVVTALWVPPKVVTFDPKPQLVETQISDYVAAKVAAAEQSKDDAKVAADKHGDPDIAERSNADADKTLDALRDFNAAEAAETALANVDDYEAPDAAEADAKQKP